MSVGRPTYFVPEVKAKILHAIRKGAPYELAANYAGISYDALNNWRKKAENEQIDEYVEFFKQLKEAEGEASILWLEKIDHAMEESWQAAAWKLERRYYKHFSANAQNIEHEERLQKIENNLQKKE